MPKGRELLYEVWVLGLEFAFRYRPSRLFEFFPFYFSPPPHPNLLAHQSTKVFCNFTCFCLEGSSFPRCLHGCLLLAIQVSSYRHVLWGAFLDYPTWSGHSDISITSPYLNSLYFSLSGMFLTYCLTLPSNSAGTVSCLLFQSQLGNDKGLAPWKDLMNVCWNNKQMCPLCPNMCSYYFVEEKLISPSLERETVQSEMQFPFSEWKINFISKILVI